MNLINDLKQEAEQLNNTHETPSAKELLAMIMAQIETIDFNELLELKDGGDKPKQKHYIVAIIEKILAIAIQNDWGLCRQYDFIYVYNGQYWQQIDKYELKFFLGQAAEKMGYNKMESRYYEFQDKLYKQFLAASIFSIPETPQNKVLINLKNGTAEITTKGLKLRDFDRHDFLTYQLPFEYKPDAKSPIFDRFIKQVLPDVELQNVAAEFFGYIFTKHLKLEKCLLFYGGGANGKSVFFEVINALVGEDNITNFSLGNLKEEHNRALIQNKLLNYGSEIRGNIEADVFKQLVSGEPIQARLKYGNAFIMRNYAKLAFNCNSLPNDVEQTNAYFRRFIIVPFDVTIPEEEQNPYLANQIISNELAGVFNWMLLGLNRLLKNNNFSPCERIKKEVNTYKTQSDSVYLFLEDTDYHPSNERAESLKVIYREYKIFCSTDGYRPISNRKFAKRLRDIGYFLERRTQGMVIFIEKKYS